MTRQFGALCALSLALTSGHAHAQARSTDNPATDRDAFAEAMAVDEYILRIQALDDAGPQLDAVIVYNPTASVEARRLMSTGLLQGRSVLVKDNIETREFPTTAGSLALANNRTGRDAPLIANLRAAGGVVLGKTNLSEWANIRSNDSTSGWSAVEGLTRNPHAIDRNTCGSSSGSAAAVAAGFAWGAIGTETNGSITCPASITSVVGFKPSVGLVSRTHVVPISSTQDTAGPMARTVHDAALLLSAMAGEDAADPVTMGVPRVGDYSEGLDDFSLQGVRFGVMREQIGENPQVAQVFENALSDLERAGAVLVDIEFEPDGQMYGDSFTVLLFELREEMGRYLRSLPEIEDGETPRSLADLVAFNDANADTEMRWFGQDIFERAVTTTDRAAYEKARENAVRIAGEETLDRLLTEHDVQFLVAPTRGPAWMSDLVLGDHFDGSIGFGSPAAIAGYPHLTVPMGSVERLPVGISFFGAKWADQDVLKAGAAYEKARTAELPAPSFRRWRPVAPAD